MDLACIAMERSRKVKESHLVVLAGLGVDVGELDVLVVLGQVDEHATPVPDLHVEHGRVGGRPRVAHKVQGQVAVALVACSHFVSRSTSVPPSFGWGLRWGGLQRDEGSLRLMGKGCGEAQEPAFRI